MIDVLFYHGSEVVIVKIEGNHLRFGSTVYGSQLAEIDGLKLDYHGTIREFSDLKDDLEWREKAIQRFKAYIETLSNEDEIADYIIKELNGKGYKPKLKQKSGFRPIRLQ